MGAAGNTAYCIAYSNLLTRSDTMFTLRTGLLICLLALTSASAPDTSLTTTPVLYYGANWNRSQVNIDVLAKMQIVVLMQEDGHCWETCCPFRFNGTHSQCGWSATDPDATSYTGCDASCAEHGSQEDVFKRIAASAQQQGLAGPHAVLYMNAVYLWPFDAASALGAAAMVTDVNGKPHEESCDPGIFPSYFFDFGKPAGSKAWLDIIRTHIVDGAADGVYVDCDPLIPFHCSGNGTCQAKRNGKTKSTNEQVTQTTVDAYIKGKNATLQEAFRLVSSGGNNGTFYNKGAPSNMSFEACVNRQGSEGDCSGNIIWIKILPPPRLHESIVANMASGKPYVVVGGANSYSNPKFESLPSGQNISDGQSLKYCSDDVLAQFLLAVEPGAYLLCNGWDTRFGRPLGHPTGPAASSGHVWSRSFKSGVVATWNTNTNKGSITWPGVPTPPPTPVPPPSPAPGPEPKCPGPKCPPVPKSNYKGCYVDKVKGKCDLPVVPPHGTGHCNKAANLGAPAPLVLLPVLGPETELMSVEQCNALCSPLGYKYFGLQAGHACFCGNSYGSMGKAAAHDCNVTCRGDGSETCGGPDRNSVYAAVEASR
jgi:hypothetical protein